MDIQITDLPQVTRAALNGRLDTANVNKGEAEFIATVVGKAQHVVIDLSGVSFIASLGIRMLLSAARTLGRSGAKMALYGATPLVLEIIETTALDEIIPVVSTEAEAVALVAE
jgi:anti-sigma B factor antagonist